MQQKYVACRRRIFVASEKKSPLPFREGGWGMGAPLCAIRGNKVGVQERCPQTWRSRRMVDIAPCATPHVYNATEYPDRGEGYVCAHATGAVSPHIAAINLAS